MSGWVKSLTSTNGSAGSATFRAVTLTSAGNIVVVGDASNYSSGASSGTYNFGAGSLTVKAPTSALAVGYNSSGTVLWSTIEPTANTSTFRGLTADGSGNFFAVGSYSVDNAPPSGYANPTGASLSLMASYPLIVGFNSSGSPVWSHFTSHAGSVGLTFGWYGASWSNQLSAPYLAVVGTVPGGTTVDAGNAQSLSISSTGGSSTTGAFLDLK